MRYFLCICFLLSLGYETYGQNIRAKVFSQLSIASLNLDAVHGSYQIHDRLGFISELIEGQSMSLQINTKGQIHASQNGIFLGLYDTLLVFQSKHSDYLNLKPSLNGKNKTKPRQYKGDFEISISNKSLHVVNIIFRETYLEGVLASEAGIHCEKEYYKVQAIISRTFLRNNMAKHSLEGFNVCDAVHCQAYYGRYQGESNNVTSGVKETFGLVLVDSNNFSFPTFFSANCGGQSAETDQVWNLSLPNYISQRDTFCIHTRQANWEKYISKAALLSFISEKYFFDISKKSMRELVFNFDQKHRKTFFIDPAYGIPLRDIRSQFRLRSTFFSCEPVGDKVLLKGRGFGHGIGLCQEGAMNMVKTGYSFDEILRFYFKGAVLTSNLSTISHW